MPFLHFIYVSCSKFFCSRWEDPQFRKVWEKILEGGSAWKDHDSFDASPRLDAKQDLYNAPLVLLTLQSNDNLTEYSYAIEISAVCSVAGRAGRHFQQLVLVKAHSVSFPCYRTRPLISCFAHFSVPNLGPMAVSLLMIGSSILKALRSLEALWAKPRSSTRQRTRTCS